MLSTLAFISSICSSVMLRPSSCSASARAIQHLRQVENFFWAPQSCDICFVAKRSTRGETYSVVIRCYSGLICLLNSLSHFRFSESRPKIRMSPYSFGIQLRCLLMASWWLGSNSVAF